MHFIEYVLENVTHMAVLLFEVIGVILIIYTGLRGIYDLAKTKKMRYKWMETLALALSFLLIAEMLETVFVTRWIDLLTLGGIFIIRALMVFLMHWEMKHEE